MFGGLDGGTGGDHLTGGAGVDTFVFTDRLGNDVVVDWQAGVDRLDFSGHSGVNGIGDLTITQSGADTRISFGADSILFQGASPSEFGDSAFVF